MRANTSNPGTVWGSRVLIIEGVRCAHVAMYLLMAMATFSFSASDGTQLQAPEISVVSVSDILTSNPYETNWRTLAFGV
ncbi:hypothetical protein BDQ94DRAFT_150482, partial [Aspergillus welwitschiae]